MRSVGLSISNRTRMYNNEQACRNMKPTKNDRRVNRTRRQLREALTSRVSAAQVEAFQFMGARCARMTELVMARIAALPGAQA